MIVEVTTATRWNVLRVSVSNTRTVALLTMLAVLVSSSIVCAHNWRKLFSLHNRALGLRSPRFLDVFQKGLNYAVTLKSCVISDAREVRIL